MELLNHVYLDNTIKAYLMVGGTILAAIVLKRIISRYIASIVLKLSKRIWKTLNGKAFIDLVIAPIEMVLVIAITVFSLDKLKFPVELNYEIYGHSIKDIITRTGTAIIIVAFIWLLLRLIDFVALALKEQAHHASDVKDNQLIIFFRDFLKVIIGIVGILLIIKACFNQHIGNLLTGLSIVGAALALAAKESLENLIASFIIFFDKPFFTDDVVKINNITGKVEKIGLRSTRIRTADKTLVTVPNKQMVDSVVDNQSMRTQRRTLINIELSPTTHSVTAQTFIDAIKKLLASNGAQIISSTVYFKELSKVALLISVEYFTETFTQEEVDTFKQQINFSIKKLIEENSIQLAGETSTIIISNENKEE
ncbi:mechanosensitive ion channel family protein [Ferruginibacter albus]|uniref:mechanosensitive ion channel family protein n=1 Tax=Ferruginibacter albus TaxID=2875540 RepID=UPI001CC73CE7|nr:mechanosensitive ion channel domain-containing protein [Ferruginibacter albus]UAY51858.1 mechanosensitive ion channel [Ferruginibacter albus]